MRCPNCDHLVRKNTKFCPGCGTAIIIIQEEPSTNLGDKIELCFLWIVENWFIIILGLGFIFVIAEIIKEFGKELFFEK